jgi:transcriptional regulator with XRE-family HTH domain
MQKTGTTQDVLAARLGISRSYVSLLAAGYRQPGLKLALRIQTLTGVPASSLVSSEAVA